MNGSRQGRCGAAVALLAGLVLLSTASFAAPPPGYYDTVDTTDPTTLRTTLHDVIDDHTRYPYTSTATDTWDILENADEDPNNAGNILDLYKNASYPKFGGGNDYYQREHVWPSSYGFPNDNAGNYPYTDCHNLHLCDGSYNATRSNKPYRNCDPSCSELPTEYNNGQGGGTGAYPGNSNWTSGSFTTGTWETWIGKRGDVARSLFYLDVRYEGGTHGITGAAEPDLILTDNEALIDASNTGSNESIAYMGMLSVLLQWHQEDPVDADEQIRNDVVYAYQGNRNPFVDHPEWVDCVFNGVCGSVECVGNPDCDDGLFCNGAETCVSGTCQPGSDPCPGQSCDEVTDTCVSSGGTPWINEFHYDNDGTDTGEFVEIAGPAGVDLSGWQVLGYNGNGGTVYDTIALSGTIPTQQGCMGTLSFAFPSMQNGSPDGLALIDDTGAVVEFISYEGVITAADGPAFGMTSIDIGVSESSTTPVGYSLQLAGTGSAAANFTWQSPAAHTEGLPNNGQTLDGCGGCTGDAECDDGLYCNGVETCVAGSCQPGSAPDCDDGIACTVDSCNETTDSCDYVADDAACDDGLFCNGAETCSPAVGCVAGTSVNCDDGISCTDDSCNETTDSCDNVANDAHCPDDGLFCSGLEYCDELAGCTSTGDPCLGSETCNEDADTCDPSTCNGDGTCDPGEDCNNCPADCISGGGTAFCGDGICQPATGEDCLSCPADCNGKQTGAAKLHFCCGDGDGSNPVDCTDPRCNQDLFSCSDAPADPYCCGDLLCEGQEDSFNCAIDCGAAPYCGDAFCDPGEDSCNCAADCGTPPAAESACTDGMDNDCDGLTDCDDTADCGADPACACLPKSAQCTLDSECCSNWCHRGFCK